MLLRVGYTPYITTVSKYNSYLTDQALMKLVGESEMHVLASYAKPLIIASK
jgi:hypothetical protein